MEIRWPEASDRLVIAGSTGGGKTQAAAWHLSQWDFNKFPWVMVNTKDDDLLNTIARFPGVKEIGIDQTPSENGLYHLRPLPDDGERLDEFLKRVWQRQRCGVYIDEVYMIQRDAGLNRLLTQGRSRRNPMIILTQRPAWLSRFVFSEASFIQVFNLNDEDDRKTMRRHIRGYDVDRLLPAYHSLWYDVGKATTTPLSPVPERAQILEVFRRKLTPPDTTVIAEPDNIPARRFI